MLRLGIRVRAKAPFDIGTPQERKRGDEGVIVRSPSGQWGIRDDSGRVTSHGMLLGAYIEVLPDPTTAPGEMVAPRPGEVWRRTLTDDLPFTITKVGDSDRCTCGNHVSWVERFGVNNGVCMTGWMRGGYKYVRYVGVVGQERTDFVCGCGHLFAGDAATHRCPDVAPPKAASRERPTYESLMREARARDGVAELPACQSCKAVGPIGRHDVCAACHARDDARTAARMIEVHEDPKPAEPPPWRPSCAYDFDIPDVGEYGSSL